MTLLRLLAASAVALVVSACSGASSSEPIGDSADEIRVTRSFVAKGTAYYPANSALEGGFTDRRGVRLKTLQQFLAGQASYVSVAMDVNAFKYGQRLRIKELEAKYGRSIVFRVVDTGGAFRGKGTSRIDVCVANLKASSDATINGRLHIDVIDETAPDPAPAPASSEDTDPGTEDGDPGTGDSADPTDPAPAPAPAPSPSPSPSSGGAACASDGACNPGNDGSGLICVGGQCVPGCHTNAQCPGITTCHGGECR